MPDSCEYFFDNIDRICSDNYIPKDEDILLVRRGPLVSLKNIFLLKIQNFISLMLVDKEMNVKNGYIALKM